MITIITAVYNRAILIQNLYESLKRQTSKEFEWMIMDDGSEDNIEQVVDCFLKDNHIKIKFFKMPHGGKHRAINKAVKLCDADAIVFVDSDDILLANAVERLNCLYQMIIEKNDVIAVAAMMIDKDGNISGKLKKIEKPLEILWSDKNQYGLNGEYVYIFKRAAWEQNPLPEYEGEIFISEAIFMMEMSIKGGKIIYTGEVLEQYEYQNDGLSKNIDNLFRNNPKGYAHLCIVSWKGNDDYNNYIEVCRNYYEVCYSSLNDKMADGILGITLEQKSKIAKKINQTLTNIKKLKGTLGIYGFGYYGHKIRRYLDILNKQYILIDKEGKNIKTDDVITLNDKSCRADTVIVCIKKCDKEIIRELNKKMPNAFVVNVEQIYCE